MLSEVAIDDATSRQIEPEGFKKIGDISCLIIWVEKDNVMLIKYYERFRQNLPNAQFEEIADAGHSLIDEKTALIYEKLRTFFKLMCV
jgi:pimeloyl-ACP methyl ester carboxylesterase